MKTSDTSSQHNTVDQLVAEFKHTLQVSWELPGDLAHQAIKLLNSVGQNTICPETKRRHLLISLVRSKFHANRSRAQSFIDAAAKNKRYFDPQTKAQITLLFDRAERADFDEWAKSEQLPAGLLHLFEPVSEEEALEHLGGQLTDAKINRSDARTGVQEERRQSILRSLFGSWIFQVVEPRKAMAFNAKLPVEEIEEDYFNHLQRHYPKVLGRPCGAYAIAVSGRQIQKLTAGNLRAVLYKEIQAAYKQLSNSSYLIIRFEFPEEQTYHNKAWGLIHDLTIYAERCKQSNLSAGYFRPIDIEQTTTSYIASLESGEAKFNVYQYGFAFRDCIVICTNTVSLERTTDNVDTVLLLMEKNVADERPIPCPACRSLDIRGNSYSIFGVKGWECQNPLCPERSAFDRGNRFSLISTMREGLSRGPNGLIPEESLVKWKLDVVGEKEHKDILEMIVRHYSFPGDDLIFVNWDKVPKTYLGRRITNRKFRSSSEGNKDPLNAFEKTPYFNRYLNVSSVISEKEAREIQTPWSWLTLYEGSCLQVLHSAISDNTLDGAVTSPPYFNAREYATWPNLYCYLYDMKVAAEGVYRVLKPGGYYLYNIFDYFDNDNILAMSALGKRRLPLGAYMAQIFRKCGFILEGDIVWHKGEIEGKRNYNQGNRAPFYQLPLNTWEHILVLRKPGTMVPSLTFPQAIFCRPVLKWFGGKNRHGHSAPFPTDLPELLCSKLPPGANILDPFAGSLTTAIVCYQHEQKATMIELHKSYCDLGLRKISDIEGQLPLFQRVSTKGLDTTTSFLGRTAKLYRPM